MGRMGKGGGGETQQLVVTSSKEGRSSRTAFTPKRAGSRSDGEHPRRRHHAVTRVSEHASKRTYTAVETGGREEEQERLQQRSESEWIE